jgi:hypothetical protein
MYILKNSLKASSLQLLEMELSDEKEAGPEMALLLAILAIIYINKSEIDQGSIAWQA